MFVVTRHCAKLLFKLSNTILCNGQLLGEVQRPKTSVLQSAKVAVQLRVGDIELLLQMFQLSAKDRLVRISNCRLQP